MQVVLTEFHYGAARLKGNAALLQTPCVLTHILAGCPPKIHSTTSTLTRRPHGLSRRALFTEAQYADDGSVLLSKLVSE